MNIINYNYLSDLTYVPLFRLCWRNVACCCSWSTATLHMLSLSSSLSSQSHISSLVTGPTRSFHLF